MKNKMIIIALLLAAGLPARADIFLAIPGIPGEATFTGHEGEIEVIDWQLSVANLNNMPVVMPLTLTHRIDKATPKLIEATILGTDLEVATLAVTQITPTPIDVIVLRLEGARVVSVKSSAADTQTPVETVTLTCVAFDLAYTEIDDMGNPVGTVEVAGSCGN